MALFLLATSPLLTLNAIYSLRSSQHNPRKKPNALLIASARDAVTSVVNKKGAVVAIRLMTSKRKAGEAGKLEERPYAKRFPNGKQAAAQSLMTTPAVLEAHITVDDGPTPFQSLTEAHAAVGQGLSSLPSSTPAFAPPTPQAITWPPPPSLKPAFQAKPGYTCHDWVAVKVGSGVVTQGPQPKGIVSCTPPVKVTAWTQKEDETLREAIQSLYDRTRIKWERVAKSLPTRTGKQCRERWHNQLDPSINKGEWSQLEDELLMSAHRIHGNKWAEIAKVSVNDS